MNAYIIAADLILAAHVGVVLFVVGGQLLILLGGLRGWAWVRRRVLRLLHLVLIVYIAAQAWLGQLCPLTVWEQALRAHAGQRVYQESFVEYWLGRLLYIDAPWWMFVALYSGFALLVALSWWWVPPVSRGK